MNANEGFEAFAKRFQARFGYLPPGKDDPARPDAYRILIDLAECFAESERRAPNAELTLSKPCPECKVDEFVMKGNDIHCWNCGRLVYKYHGSDS